MCYVLIYAAFVAAQATVLPVPDISGWESTTHHDLEFRVDDYRTPFVGQIVVYQNPTDPNEFVRVYRRQAVLVSERARTRSGKDRAQTGIDLGYHVRRQMEALEKAQQEGEAFAYVRWRTVRDERTGQDYLDGAGDSWLLNAKGAWTYRPGMDLKTTTLTEPDSIEPYGTQIVGLVFTLGEVTHILRIDPQDLIAAEEESTGGGS